jgi:hypothetical protein
MMYRFPRANMLMVTSHADALDIQIVSLQLDSIADEYVLETDVPFPADQLEHLGMTEV